jgi:hypothetical protein
MSDTTTTLNSGSGGDSMDESLVAQSDAVTQAKRPRVVIGGDAGYDSETDENDLVQPVREDPGANPASLPVLVVAVVNDTPESGYAPGELRRLSLTSSGRLRVASEPAQTKLDFFAGCSATTDPGDMTFCCSNPFGT